MGDKLLEAGKIVGTHGVRGEVRIQPWADSPEFLTRFKSLYIDGEPVNILRARVHKSLVIAVLDGVDNIDAAIKLKNKTVSIRRDDVDLDDGQHFVVDLIGLRAIDSETGAEFGTVADLLNLPANDVYVINTPEREMLVPAVPEFVEEVNVSEGFIKVRLKEGL